MSEGYSVVFSGELLEGTAPERVRAGLVKIFGITDEQAGSILAGGQRVIKRGVTEEKADRYLEVLGRLGMVATKVAAPAAAGAAGDAADKNSVIGPPAGEAAGEHPFRFTGEAGEYFRIWIVNVLLSVITLGVYSAWAKVRNNRYFYGNTEVAGDRFDYLAEPLAILKGRAIALVLFLVYAVGGNLSPALSAVTGLLLMAVLPWLIARSLAFRNRNTALRNIRFGFDGGYGGAFKAFILWPLLGVVSLGLLMPYAVREQDRYMVGNARYGTTPFEFGASVKSYYKLFGALSLILIGGIIGVIILSMAIGLGAGMAAAPDPRMAAPPEVGPLAALPALTAMVLYLYAFAYFAAKRHNLIYSGARFAGHGFGATMAPGRLAWIQITNWTVTLLTLGLARPWAKVRLARYKAACLTLAAAAGLDAFVAAEEERVNAVGEEVGEAFDFDIGL